MLGPAVRQPLRLRGHAEGGRGAAGGAERPRAAAAAALPGAHGALRARRPEPELGAGQEAHPAAAVGGGGGQLHRGAALRGLPRTGAGRQQGAAAPVTQPTAAAAAPGSPVSLGTRPALSGAGFTCPPRGSVPARGRGCAVPRRGSARRGLGRRGWPASLGGTEQAGRARSWLRSVLRGGGPWAWGNPPNEAWRCCCCSCCSYSSLSGRCWEIPAGLLVFLQLRKLRLQKRLMLLVLIVRQAQARRR